MAVNKVVNRRTNTHAAMRNCIEYVLKEQKITDGLVYVTGPYRFDEINYDNVYNAFLDEKKLWDKDSGRMYAHNIISFHKDEKITPEEAFEFGKEFADKWFKDFQTLIAVHQDRDHLHIHFVTNTVSYVDGYKLHTTKKDLEDMKKHTNDMCVERGLTVAEKGRHFDGTEIAQGDITTWSKDKYNLIHDLDKKSYVADCAVAVLKAMEMSYSREDFISEMLGMGWQVNWTDNRKHITFVNENGEKVRDSNLSKTFNLNINKEAIEYEYTRKNEERRQQLEAEYARESGNDTDAVIGKLEAEISTAESDRADRKSELGKSGAKRENRELERQRLAAAERARIESARRAEVERRARLEQQSRLLYEEECTLGL